MLFSTWQKLRLKDYWRYIFVITKQSDGFSLLELLIVAFIVSLLVAISFPSLIGQIDKARYTQAIVDMDCIADELRGFDYERQYFPADIGNNNQPPGVNCFPVYPQDKTPFDSKYDYESWNAPGGKCYIQITFFGKNQVRNSPTNAVVFPQSGIYDDYGDDLILSLGVFDVPCQ